MKRQGFSFVEVMVAAGLLGVLAFGAYGLLSDQFSAGIDVGRRDHLDRVARRIADDLGRYSTSALFKLLPSPRWRTMKDVARSAVDDQALERLANLVDKSGLQGQVAFREVSRKPPAYELHVRVEQRRLRRTIQTTIVRHIMGSGFLPALPPPSLTRPGGSRRAGKGPTKVTPSRTWGKAESWTVTAPQSVIAQADRREGEALRLTSSDDDGYEATSDAEKSLSAEAAWGALGLGPRLVTPDGRKIEVVNGVRHIGGVTATRGIVGATGILASGSPRPTGGRPQRARVAATFFSRTGVSPTRAHPKQGEIPDGEYFATLEAYDGRKVPGKGRVVGAYLLAGVTSDETYTMVATEKWMNGHRAMVRVNGDDVLEERVLQDLAGKAWLLQRTEEHLVLVQLVNSGRGRLTLRSLPHLDGGAVPTALNARFIKSWLQGRMLKAAQGPHAKDLLRAQDHVSAPASALQRIRCAGGCAPE